MAKYLRMVRQGRWGTPPWFNGPSAERQANVLMDLAAETNTLSVYLADTEEMRRHAVAGLAANRKKLANLDYALIEEDLLLSLNLKAVQNKGATPHSEANSLHHDIEHLTVRHILALVNSISMERIERINKNKVGDFIKSDVSAGLIDKEAMNQDLREKLGL